MVAGPSPVKASSVVAIGECMLEMRKTGENWQLGHGGDTFNTALYLARLGESVAFFTALGDDPFSAKLKTDWQDEGLLLDLVLTAPARLPGLYAIVTDANGERDFHYWRTQAPVRDLFRLPGAGAALVRSACADLLYISGITLSLFEAADRARLAMLAREVRDRGGTVAFDPNYRASLWPSPALARAAIAEFAQMTTIVLGTFEDEAALYGDATPASTQARWHAAGVAEVVIKLGADGCMITDGRIIPPRRSLAAVDTTGAGDAFNAGYLAALRRGLRPDQAAGFANHLGGLVIGCPGAILPDIAMPSFDDIIAAIASPT